MKIAIIGHSGSGKSTLAKYISNYYKLPLLYLDTIHFKENWQFRNREEALSIVSEFMKNKNWVIDGNYSKLLKDKRLNEADYIIYMNFNRFNCLFRALKRYLKYKNTIRESSAKGCIEKLDIEFIYWILYKGRTKEKLNGFNNIVSKYKYKTIVIKNQIQLNNFIKNISSVVKY